MVNEIVVGSATRVFFVDHTHRIGQPINHRRIAGNAYELRVEIRNVRLELPRRVTLWINGDHDELNVASTARRLRQHSVYLVENCQRRRAKVWAKRVTEYQKTPSVFECLIAEGCVVMFDEFEVGEPLSGALHASARQLGEHRCRPNTSD